MVITLGYEAFELYSPGMLKVLERLQALGEYVQKNRNLEGLGLSRQLYNELIENKVFRMEKQAKPHDLDKRNGQLFQRLGEIEIIIPEGVQALVYESPLDEILRVYDKEIKAEDLGDLRVQRLINVIGCSGYNFNVFNSPCSSNSSFRALEKKVGKDNLVIIPTSIFRGVSQGLGNLFDPDYVFF